VKPGINKPYPEASTNLQLFFADEPGGTDGSDRPDMLGRSSLAAQHPIP